MTAKPNCYVSMPFGRKSIAGGSEADFDQIYREMIRPAVEMAGLGCFRADEFTGGALILKSIFSAIMSSELMVADVTSSNPGVMYEIGVRHATSARPTIIVAASHTRLPFNLNFLQTLRYEVDADGSVPPNSIEEFRRRLFSAIESSLRAPAAFSPLFELFPELQARMQPAPPVSTAAEVMLKSDPQARRASKHTFLRAAEEQTTSQQETDPTAMLSILKGYQEVSAWDDLVRFADTMPQELRENPDVAQRVALALNRRAQEGDRQRAVEILTRLLERTGGDGETYGILGRVYKDLFRETADQKFWQMAYDAYRAGFEKQPDNYYPGVNAVTLLIERGTPESRRELKQLLPRVKQALQQRLDTRPADYWDLATGMHLAAVGREWSEARTWADQVLKSSPSSWMLATTLNDLRALAPGMAETDRAKLTRLIQPLEQQVRGELA